MSATAISSMPSFAEYAARWDWAMLPAPMTPTRNFVMRVSFTCGDRRSGEQVLGVGDPALAAQEAVLPALELDRGVAGEVGVADRAGHRTQVDVAVADHRPAQVLAAAAAEPAGTGGGVGRADVEVLEVDDHRVGEVLGDRDRRVLVDAHEVADVQGGEEVRLVDGVDDAPHALRGLHEEAVVLEAGGDAAGRGVLRDLLARGDDVRQHLLEQRGVVTLVAGVGHHVVSHPRDPQPPGEVHVLLHPRDLRRIPGREVRADGQVGQRHAGRGGVLADAVHVGGVRGDVRDRRVGVVAEHGELEMLTLALRDPVDDLRKGHLAGGELRVEAVRAEAEDEVGGHGGVLAGRGRGRVRVEWMRCQGAGTSGTPVIRVEPCAKPIPSAPTRAPSVVSRAGTRSGACSVISRRPTALRSGPSSVSPARESPPPTTTRSGSTVSSTVARRGAICAQNSSPSDRAAASPAAARSRSCRPSSPVDQRSRPRTELSVQRLPRWLPSSPARRWAPCRILPPTTTATDTRWPSCRSTMLCAGGARWCSARAASLMSFSTATGRPRRSERAAPRSTPSSAGTARLRTTRSSGPRMPGPAIPTAPGAIPAASPASVSARTSGGRGSEPVVGAVERASTVPPASVSRQRTVRVPMSSAATAAEEASKPKRRAGRPAPPEFAAGAGAAMPAACSSDSTASTVGRESPVAAASSASVRAPSASRSTTAQSRALASRTAEVWG